MSLVTEINRTEREKNKTKKVATQIDNKLVELGGEQATNLSDVPKKINELSKQYKKYAKVVYNRKINGSTSGYNAYANFYIPMENLEFNPNFAIIQLAHMSNNNVIPNDIRHYSIFLDLNNTNEKKWKVTNDNDYSRYMNITFLKHAKSIQVDYKGQTYQGFEITLKNVIFIGE